MTARFVYGLNQSLDGYVDHDAFMPGPKMFEYFIEQTRSSAGSVYGTNMYEIMRYWDRDDETWGPQEHAYAEAWRRMPKWVVSRSLTEVGPNATLVTGDLEPALWALKSERKGTLEVAGPCLAASLSRLGLIDEYRIYLHPVVVGSGTPYFHGAQPAVKLLGHDELVEGVIRLSYIPV